MTTTDTGLRIQAASRPNRPRWIDVTALALGAILLRIPAYLAPMNLGYDDGGYGLAAMAMREGFDPHHVIDPLFFREPKSGEYRPIDAQAYARLVDGSIRL